RAVFLNIVAPPGSVIDSRSGLLFRDACHLARSGLTVAVVPGEVELVAVDLSRQLRAVAPAGLGLHNIFLCAGQLAVGDLDVAALERADLGAVLLEDAADGVIVLVLRDGPDFAVAVVIALPRSDEWIGVGSASDGDASPKK